MIERHPVYYDVYNVQYRINAIKTTRRRKRKIDIDRRRAGRAITEKMIKRSDDKFSITELYK